jgi:hypothetical protein
MVRIERWDSSVDDGYLGIGRKAPTMSPTGEMYPMNDSAIAGFFSNPPVWTFVSASDLGPDRALARCFVQLEKANVG